MNYHPLHFELDFSSLNLNRLLQELRCHFSKNNFSPLAPILHLKLQLGPAVAWCSSVLVGSYSKQLVTLLAYLFPYICIELVSEGVKSVFL